MRPKCNRFRNSTIGDSAKAKQYYAKVVTLAANADATRTEVADARAFVAKN